MPDNLFHETFGHLTDLGSRLGRQEARSAAIEARLDHELASRSWVGQALEPIKCSAMRTEHAIADLARTVGDLTSDTRSLYAAHDELLRERTEREREEHGARLQAARDNSFFGLLTHYWIPITGMVAGTSATLTIVGSWLQAYIVGLMHR